FPAALLSRMSEKPESDEFEDEEADEPVIEDGDVDLDQVIKDLDLAKRRAHKAGDPAWRRLERLLEDKHTAAHAAPQAPPRLRGLSAPASTPARPPCGPLPRPRLAPRPAAPGSARRSS